MDLIHFLSYNGLGFARGPRPRFPPAFSARAPQPKSGREPPPPPPPPRTNAPRDDGVESVRAQRKGHYAFADDLNSKPSCSPIYDSCSMSVSLLLRSKKLPSNSSTLGNYAAIPRPRQVSTIGLANHRYLVAARHTGICSHD